jgi:hypothetical protein
MIREDPYGHWSWATAALYKDGAMIALKTLSIADVEPSPSSLYGAYDINNRGQIVGAGIMADGRFHGFILTSLPEAQSWIMLLAGVGLLGLVVSRTPN